MARKPAGSSGSGRQQHEQQHYEFFGPHGPALLIVALPLTVLALPWACNERGCLELLPRPRVPGFAPGQPLLTLEALAVAAGWFGLTLLLHVLLPGRYAQGVALPDGSRLTYKLNAFSVFAVTYGSALALSRFGLGVLDLGWLAANFVPLLTASALLSTLLAVVVYAASFAPDGATGRARLLAAHGASGWPWYDFWMGRELNPRWRLGLPSWLGGNGSPVTIDVKEFCELYPGMIGWALLNLAFAARQAELHGGGKGGGGGGGGVFGLFGVGGVGAGMLLVNAFQLWYVADALLNEAAILTTMDVTTDGFGFMLAFGDLCWVPFTFSTQARFLADHPQPLGALGVLGVLSVQLLGYWVFRGANGQKDAFRRDPDGPAARHLESMPTARGTRLIVSGWWGLARHVNYLGDWLMGLAWCLPCGLAGAKGAVPYFYCLYFAALLAHRERRDEAACRAKYGDRDWGAYCARVPWRIVPYVY